MRKRRAGGTAALVLLSLLAGCGASGPEVAGSGLEEVLWRVDAPLETGETASLLENSRGQRLLLVGEETVLEVDAPFGQDTQVLTPDLDGDGREEVVLVSEAGPEGRDHTERCVVGWSRLAGVVRSGRTSHCSSGRALPAGGPSRGEGAGADRRVPNPCGGGN